jgi:hypothetical protein
MRSGRASATAQLGVADCEWVINIPGPIFSNSAMRPSRINVDVKT